MSPGQITLRFPDVRDEAEFVAAVAQSHSLHSPWVSPPETKEKFRAYLKKMAAPDAQAFLVCVDDRIGGVINLTNVVYGNFCSGYIAYYAFAHSTRQGVLTAGLQAFIERAFGELNLHRLEANIQPGNLASIALAKRCGFAKEGFSPRYLKIDGEWRDHERWALVI